MNPISEIIRIIRRLLSTDNGLISDEVEEILSNPADKKEFFEKVEQMRKKNIKEETIHLSSGKNITIALSN